MMYGIDAWRKAWLSKSKKFTNFRIAWIAALAACLAILAADSVQLKGLSGVYPQCLIGLSLALLLNIAVKEARNRYSIQDYDQELANLWRGVRQQRLRLGVFTVVWLAYPFFMSAAGFIVATTVAVAVSLWVASLRHPVRLVLASAVFAVIMAVLITSVLYIPIPGGPVDQALDHLLYVLSSR
jgi:hypothetical protein